MTKEKLQEELKSFATTFISVLAMEGLWNQAIFMGDFSQEAFKALLIAVIRAVVKSIISLSLGASNVLINSNNSVDISPPPGVVEKEDTVDGEGA